VSAISRTAVVAASAALVVLGLAPAAEASGYPSDCVVTNVSSTTKSLTCKARPAGQQWRLLVYCIGWGLQDEAYGNIVTGNGTSTARCSAGQAQYPNFVVV